MTASKPAWEHYQGDIYHVLHLHGYRARAWKLEHLSSGRSRTPGFEWGWEVRKGKHVLWQAGGNTKRLKTAKRVAEAVIRALDPQP